MYMCVLIRQQHVHNVINDEIVLIAHWQCATALMHQLMSLIAGFWAIDGWIIIKYDTKWGIEKMALMQQ